MIFETFSIVAIALLLYMTFFFLYALLRKRNDIVDIAWGFGFILVALVSLSLYEPTM